MGRIAFSTDSSYAFGCGLFHLAFAQLVLPLQQLLLTLGLLQVGVLLGIDLREAGRLLAQAPQFLFQLIAAAAFGL